MNVLERINNDVPLLIMLIGVPGSGKSTYAEDVLIRSSKGYSKPNIHSSDRLRGELFGSEAKQGDNNLLFTELHKRIKEDLMLGKDVIYDATNIKKKNRIQFLNELKKINCNPICVCVMATYKSCLEHNQNRERKVPEEVIHRMITNWQPPHYSEGFDKIIFAYFPLTDEEKEYYTISKFFEIANKFDQENKHHNLTLGEHCTKAATYIQNNNVCKDNFALLIAAMLHDNGKLHTKTKTNAKGIEDGDCHYYQHNCRGAYEVLFYLLNTDSISDEEKIYISNLIYYHMCPYVEWKQSERVLKRDRELLGDRLYNDVLLLHDADIYAH